MKKNADLPFASTLCGSCTNVCPVKINIHEQLWSWRQLLMKEGYGGIAKTFSMKAMAAFLANPAVFKLGGKIGRKLLQFIPGLVSNQLNPWFKNRELPSPPKQSFNEWYQKNKKH
jgi:L-lactate dehydrogenase complex protein LldF